MWLSHVPFDDAIGPRCQYGFFTALEVVSFVLCAIYGATWSVTTHCMVIYVICYPIRNLYGRPDFSLQARDNRTKITFVAFRLYHCRKQQNSGVSGSDGFKMRVTTWYNTKRHLCFSRSFTSNAPSCRVAFLFKSNLHMSRRNTRNVRTSRWERSAREAYFSLCIWNGVFAVLMMFMLLVQLLLHTIRTSCFRCCRHLDAAHIRPTHGKIKRFSINPPCLTGPNLPDWATAAQHSIVRRQLQRRTQSVCLYVCVFLYCII